MALFYRIMPRKEAVSLWRIRLRVTFVQPDNFCKELLTFEVVNFPSVYHALLGRPCFAKFMAVPNYTYLKLKMPGPKGVITVEGSFEQAYHCEQDCVTQAAALVAPCASDSPGHDAGRASMEEATKAAAVPDQPSIDGSGGSTGPFVQALGHAEGVDPIEVSSDISP
jgi:hypothetical protein